MQPMSIDHSKQVLGDIQKILIEAIDIVKHFHFLTALPKLVEIGIQLRDIVRQAPLVLPEMKSLDSAEAAQLASASYDFVKAVIAEIVAP